MRLRELMLNIYADKKLCPHLNDPFDDCYCVRMSSQDIERAVYLCSKSFELCDIYKDSNGNGNGNGNGGNNGKRNGTH
jgi:hypothetical protein